MINTRKQVIYHIKTITFYTLSVSHLLCLSVQPSAVQKVDWFPECTTETPDADELRDWMKLGAVNTNTEDTRLHNWWYTTFTLAHYLSSNVHVCFLMSYFECLQRKLKIEDEIEFCTEDLLHMLLRCKVSYHFYLILLPFLILYMKSEYFNGRYLTFREPRGEIS